MKLKQVNIIKQNDTILTSFSSDEIFHSNLKLYQENILVSFFLLSFCFHNALVGLTH